GQRVVDQLLAERLDVEQSERPRPVERLADARRLLEVELAHRLHDRDDVRRERLRDLRNLELDDLELLLLRRVVDEEVQAAALERVGDLAAVVAGQHDERHLTRRDRAELGNADLEIAQDLEQEGLELGVRLVDLVDQQDDRLLRRDRAQQRTRQDEPLREENAVLRRDALDRFLERRRAGEHLPDLVLQDLGVE